MPVKVNGSVPSYAELLSSSRRSSKAKNVIAEEKKKKTVKKKTAPVSPPITHDSEPEQPDVVVGCRVVLGSSGLFGTVRYVGETTFQAGLWVGVALDNEQGKNDGTVKGERYFTCPPNHGIFVRPSAFDVISFPTVTKNATDLSSVRPASPGNAPASPNIPTSPLSLSSSVAAVRAAAGTSLNTRGSGSQVANIRASPGQKIDSDSSFEFDDPPIASVARAYQPPPPPTYSFSGGAAAGIAFGGGNSVTAPPPPPPPLYSPTGGETSTMYGSSSSGARTTTTTTSTTREHSELSSASSAVAATAAAPPPDDQQRRLSPRRRTSALVSSIDDVLASMEYAASDINSRNGKAEQKSKPSSTERGSSSDGSKVRKSKKTSSVGRPKSPFERQGSLGRPKSPFERQYLASSSAYSTDEERLFVENLVELVAKSPVVSAYLKTEIEKHQKAAAAAAEAARGLESTQLEKTAAEKTAKTMADLQHRTEELERRLAGAQQQQQQQQRHQSDAPALATRLDSHTTATDRSIEAMGQRLERLEKAVATPIKALTQQLGDLERAVAKAQLMTSASTARTRNGGAMDNKDSATAAAAAASSETTSSELAAILGSVRALALQAHGALQLGEC